MARVFIGLGSNLGDRESNLRAAVVALEDAPDVCVQRVSRFIETLPEGGPPQSSYLNAAAELRTELTPRRLLDLLLTVEARQGRVRTERWGPRTLDLDLLLYGDEVVNEPDLRVPHPRMADRTFVLQPLADIAPDVRHPVLEKTIRQLLQELAASAPRDFP